jgi:hypothetical protein
VKVIIDRTGLNEAFSRMVDPDLRTRDCLRDDTAHTALRRTLEGDRVPILEHCLNTRTDARFAVIRAQRVEGADIDLYGVCFADEAGRADLIARGLMNEDDATFALLGSARFAAAEHNSTVARRQLTGYLQSVDADESFPALPVTNLLAQKIAPAAPTASGQRQAL